MKRLRKNKIGNIDEPLLLVFGLLMLFGIVMVYSTSSIYAETRHGSHLFFFKNQIIWVMLSIVTMFIILKLDLKRYAVYSAPLLLIVVMMLALVFLMPSRNGAHRWLMLGLINIQPSEIFKFVMIFFLAFSLSNPKRNISELKQLLFPYIPIIGVGLLLILLEPDLGTTIVIFLSALGIFFLGGARMKHLLLGFVPLIATASIVVFGLGYKKTRILDYLDSITDPLLGSYQVQQAALTLGSGGIFGVGLGDGRQKQFFLPYPHTDFVFASIGEEIGLIGLIFILVLFFFMIFRGLKIASEQPDRFGYLLASGMSLSLFLNIAINLGVATALLPVTGLPLPFLSYGGSSLLISTSAVAVLLNLSRRNTAK